MTLPNAASSVTLTGNGVTTVWDYGFIIPDAASARVGLFEIATSVLTELIASDYAITGLGNANGGTVTYPLSGSPLASTHRIVIWREVGYEQPTIITNQTPFYPKVLETQLDKIVMQTQQLAAEVSRTIKVTLGSTQTPDQFVADLQEGAANAQASASAAAASASAASASAAAAATSETNAATSATNAATSETNAAASETAAAASETAAAASETAAAASASAAATSETNAAASATTAATLIGGTVTEAVRHDLDQGLSLGQQGQGRANIGADLLGGFRNKLINSDFPIWQRNTSFTATGYTADRWYMFLGTGAAITASRQAFTLGQSDVPGNPQYFMRLNRTTTGSSVSLLMQLIEGVRTLAGKLVTLSFYAKASSAVNIESYIRQYFGSGGSPSANVDTANEVHALTTSWQKFSYTKTLASISGKTLGSNGNDALRPTFSLPTAAGAVTVDIAHVSLVEGDATTEDDPFSARHLQQELALCKRYYEVINALFLTTANTAQLNWEVEKRAIPTLVSTNLGGTGGGYNPSGYKTFAYQDVAASGFGAGTVAADAEL